MRRHLWLALGLALVLTPLAALGESRSTKSLNRIADDFSAAVTSHSVPILTPRANARWVRQLDGFERRLSHVKTSKLDSQSRITLRMLRDDLQRERARYEQGWVNEDVNGTSSLMHNIVNYMAGEKKTVGEWRDTIRLLRRSSHFVDRYVEALQRGLETGRVQPREAARSAINSLGSLTGNRSDNPFRALLPQLEESLAGKPQLPALRRELRQVLKDNVIPAHRKLRGFLKREYLPQAGKLGADRERYLHYMAEHLGPDHPAPEVLNRWGRVEVVKLQRQLERVARQIDPSAKSLSSFMAELNRQPENHYASGAELIAATQQELSRSKSYARAMAPVPRSTVKVAPVAKHEERTVAAQYWPQVKEGEVVGEVQVNTGKLLRDQFRSDMATLITHEVYGGHHLAAAYQMRETEGNRLPEYRRYAARTTFDEGWALYAEQWRADHGGFTPTERVGFLTNHLWRAARLVVDTGLHTGTMTPRQAADYFQRATFCTRGTANAEIARYIDWPGQALAYYYGKREIVRIRKQVEGILGQRFDERGFHAKLLSLGSVPLSDARQAMVSWANRRKAQLD